MKRHTIVISVITFLCCALSLSAETYYLRDRCMVNPEKPEFVFINPVGAEVARSLRNAKVLPDVPAIIPPAAFQPYLPEGSPIIGTAVLFIPLGEVPADSVEKVFSLLEEMAQSGNGKTVVIEVPNWAQMIRKEALTQEPSPQSRTKTVRGGDYVKVFMSKGSIAISFQGRAQRSGSIGEIIPVMVSATRKQLQCTVIDKGEVSLVQ